MSRIPASHSAARRTIARALAGGAGGVAALILLWGACVARAAGDPYESVFSQAATAPPPLVVHAWGTITSLEDEDGRAIAAINVEDQALPAFVERAGPVRGYANSTQPIDPTKGVAVASSDVTMCLERMAICFHRDFPVALSGVRVKAAFLGGLMTECYPPGAAVGGAATRPAIPGVPASLAHVHLIDADTVGSLEWSGLHVGPSEKGPRDAADSSVWQALRQAKAATVTTAKGECEAFLFCGGYGRLDALLRVRRDSVRHTLDITGRPPDGMAAPGGGAMHVTDMWLVDVGADQSVAFRSTSFSSEAAELGRLHFLAAGQFAPATHEVGNAERLGKQMQDALGAAGLTNAEAAALIASCSASCFQRPGQRLLYIVPQEWSQTVLPLEVSPHPGEVVHVMVGMIELVTPEQRRLLATIADGAATSAQAYAQLGRFRQALVLDESGRRPTPQLAAFIKQYGLAGAGDGP